VLQSCLQLVAALPGRQVSLVRRRLRWAARALMQRRLQPAARVLMPRNLSMASSALMILPLR